MSSCHIRIACHGKAASPVVGRAVYAFIPEVSFSCPLILLRWQIRLTCKASSSKKKKKKPNLAILTSTERSNLSRATRPGQWSVNPAI